LAVHPVRFSGHLNHGPDIEGGFPRVHPLIKKSYIRMTQMEALLLKLNPFGHVVLLF
jgi:hypothetical protein